MSRKPQTQTIFVFTARLAAASKRSVAVSHAVVGCFISGGALSIFIFNGRAVESISSRCTSAKPITATVVAYRSQTRYSVAADNDMAKSYRPIDTENAIFERYQIDGLLSKNSGGDATVAKRRLHGSVKSLW